MTQQGVPDVIAKEMEIRSATIDEGSILSNIAIRSKATWGYSDAFMEACHNELTVTKEKLSDTNFWYFVAEDKGEILGYCAVEKVTSTEYELEAIFIAPAKIGTGIGTELIKHAKEQLVLKGVSSLLIQGDPNANGFYQSLGGRRIGERESLSIPGRYLPLFRLNFLDNHD